MNFLIEITDKDMDETRRMTLEFKDKTTAEEWGRRQAAHWKIKNQRIVVTPVAAEVAAEKVVVEKKPKKEKKKKEKPEQKAIGDGQLKKALDAASKETIVQKKDEPVSQVTKV